MYELRLLTTLSLLLAACGTTDTAEPGSEVATCADEQLAMSGAWDVNTRSAATVVVSQRIVGIGGFTSDAAGSYTFTAGDILADDFMTAGTYDLAAHPMRYLEGAASADCTQPGNCDGFFALGGTLEVQSVSPFRASFTLSSLHATDGSSRTPGAALDGTVTGCLHAAP